MDREGEMGERYERERRREADQSSGMAGPGESTSTLLACFVSENASDFAADAEFVLDKKSITLTDYIR